MLKSIPDLAISKIITTFASRLRTIYKNKSIQIKMKLQVKIAPNDIMDKMICFHSLGTFSIGDGDNKVEHIDPKSLCSMLEIPYIRNKFQHYIFIVEYEPKKDKYYLYYIDKNMPTKRNIAPTEQRKKESEERYCASILKCVASKYKLKLVYRNSKL